MRFARANLRSAVLAGVCAAALAIPPSVFGGGVTLITHGLNGSTTGWVTGMANAISARAGGNVPRYRLQVASSGGTLTTSVLKLSGPSPLSTTHGEIIVVVDWSSVADGNSYNTYQVAAAVAPALTNASLVPDMNGHALVELPLHLIGHSRGGSLVCELSRLLGAYGIWVDHLTGLDTHPLNNDGFVWDGFLYSATDAPAHSYENVLWSESYYQDASWPIYGEIIPGAFWRRQTINSGGYDGLAGAHSDVHLWYHGTIDLATPTSDTEASLTSNERSSWWVTGEQSGTNAGFIYTLLGGGDRMSNLQPVSGESNALRDGFNQYYDLGAGSANNRTALASNAGKWPNPVRFDLTSTNVVEQGQTVALDISFQYAQPTNTTQSVAILADPDLNPFNGNELALLQGFASGTTAFWVGSGSVNVGIDGAVVPPGDYALLVRCAADGNERLLYAPQPIRVVRSLHRLALDITPPQQGGFTVGVNGVAGQTAVVEVSPDGTVWMPLVTNTLTSSRWEVPQTLDPGQTSLFYRARLLTGSP